MRLGLLALKYSRRASGRSARYSVLSSVTSTRERFQSKCPLYYRYHLHLLSQRLRAVKSTTDLSINYLRKLLRSLQRTITLIDTMPDDEINHPEGTSSSDAKADSPVLIIVMVRLLLFYMLFVILWSYFMRLLLRVSPDAVNPPLVPPSPKPCTSPSSTQTTSTLQPTKPRCRPESLSQTQTVHPGSSKSETKPVASFVKVSRLTKKTIQRSMREEVGVW